MTQWILLPVVGALIGWITNWVAIRMLFHPRQRRWGMQGLLPRRQSELAKSIGGVVGGELVDMQALFAPLLALDLRPHFERLVDGVLDRKLADLRSIPLLGSLFKPQTLRPIRDGVIDELVRQSPEIMQQLIAAAQQKVDIAKMVEEKVAAFDLDRLEAVVQKVAGTEFRAIEIWGAVLGAVIGLGQAALLAFT